MTSKHTPGPWTIRDTYEVWAHKGAVKVADVSIKYSTLNQAQYNSRLIAESPAMLEALREIASGHTAAASQEIARRVLARIDGKE